jgi:methylmalonic aciduria homocystinuria type C protein
MEAGRHAASIVRAVDPSALLPALRADLAAAGFDLAAVFPVDAWNRGGVHVLADHGRARGLGVVVGNSRALWPVFTRALGADPALAAEADPLDRYTERTIAGAVAATGVVASIAFAHRPPYPPIQRIAHLAGLAQLRPSHLCVHPVLGPWIAMRAVITLDADGPAEAPPGPAPCDCAVHCLPAFERAAAIGFDPADEATWRAWVAIRDACPLGAAHRYGDDQIRYHYGKDRAALTEAVAPLSTGNDPSP